MRILITGACGFVGSSLIRAWSDAGAAYEIHAFDNLLRAGSEINRADLKQRGVQFHHGDIRCASDFETLPDVDAVIDAAAMPSVLAGVSGQTSSRQLIEHNLVGTINMLEFCKRTSAAFVLLSTSRVYSIPPLANLAVDVKSDAFSPRIDDHTPAGLSGAGVNEQFSTAAPISLYGATKLASETLALEYGATFGFPVWANRCGVLAGAGQFGRPDQGIFAFWINMWLHRRPLKYIGFDGHGHQVRDCLHPNDLAPLIDAQLAAGTADVPRIVNVAGGIDSARSLRQLSAWCTNRFGAHEVSHDPAARAFDIPWLVLDAACARRAWDWAPTRRTDDILQELALHAEHNPNWLEMSQ